ncbi:alkaline phosphatase family protein [Nocardioides sp. KIGAM211]|uniref:Alkaline phosphatase family protein n=1 Tax=Nocardioides luti TaxID=2761101 RepID=A0A7X0REF9_9ACTN|nr:alkaline phosphatase family protein [Nocardioides luti]MBB6626799.1 alkaline phosphatase family protein [Nocardioides luti]
MSRAPHLRSSAVAVATSLLVLVGGACSAATTDQAAAPATPVTPGQPAGAVTPRVLAISVDALNPAAIRQLGRDGAPTLHRLLDEGASTLNARTEREQTITLPNHASMMTGRRIEASRGGHGVTWDDDRPRSTVQQAAGHAVASVFTVVHRAQGTTALFSTKPKFSLYERSWARAVDEFHVDENQAALVRTARRDLVENARTFTFLHVSLPDRAGHAEGFMSPAYVAAVQRTDELLGTVVAAIEKHPRLAESLTVVLTADHGGAAGGTSHSAAGRLANYRVPFLVWGAGVTAGDLYELNPDYADPGRTRPSYAGTQPVRNGDVANLATGLLGLGAVPGSELDAEQDLDVR